MNEQFDKIVSDLKDKNKITEDKRLSLTEQAHMVRSMDAVQNAVVNSIRVLLTALLKENLNVDIKNHLESIKTPDALVAAGVIRDSIVQMQKSMVEKETDLQPILTHFKAVLEALSKLPTEYPSFPEMPTTMAVNNLEEVTKELKTLGYEISKLELAPNINVATPDVKVAAPIVNINLDKELKVLEDAINNLAPKKEDSEEMMRHHQMMMDALSSVENAVRSIEFPVPNIKPTYVGTDGVGKAPVLTSDGEVPTHDVNNASKVSSLNSTDNGLAINGIFTGTWEDITKYAEIIVTVYADQPSLTDGLKIEWSVDGIDVHGDDLFTIGANSGKTFSFPCQTKYFRVRYFNDGVAALTFHLQTVLKARASKGSSHRLKDVLVQEDDAIVTKSLVAGKTTGGGGGIVDVKVNPSGALTVEATISGSVATQENQFATRLDDTNSPILYIGKSIAGSSTSSAVWQIAKLDTTSGLVKTWADGDVNFNNIWDNRTSLTYN